MSINKLGVFITIFFLTILSCSKEEEPVDREFYKVPDIWLFNANDSLMPNHSLDTLIFDQARGTYTLAWTSTSINNIKYEVRAIPQRNDTFHYTSLYVNKIDGIFRGFPFEIELNATDTFFTIINANGILIVNSDTLHLKPPASSTSIFRTIQLKMTDTIP